MTTDTEHLVPMRGQEQLLLLGCRYTKPCSAEWCPGECLGFRLHSRMEWEIQPCISLGTLGNATLGNATMQQLEGSDQSLSLQD